MWAGIGRPVIGRRFRPKGQTRLLFDFAQLEQHAPVDFWMQEGDVETFGALARRLVDQLDTVASSSVRLACRPVDGEREVLDAFALFLDELADRDLPDRSTQAARSSTDRS